MNRLPVYATQLVEELNKDFPARCIAPGQTLEDAHRYAGKRELVEGLLRRLEATVEQDPTRPVLK